VLWGFDSTLDFIRRHRPRRHVTWAPLLIFLVAISHIGACRGPRDAVGSPPGELGKRGAARRTVRAGECMRMLLYA
jgi:hypothetical protein